jgi:hypothetical protein
MSDRRKTSQPRHKPLWLREFRVSKKVDAALFLAGSGTSPRKGTQLFSLPAAERAQERGRSSFPCRRSNEIDI